MPLHSLFSANPAPVPIAVVIDQENACIEGMLDDTRLWRVSVMYNNGNSIGQYNLPDQETALAIGLPYVTNNPRLRWVKEQSVAVDSAFCLRFNCIGPAISFGVDVPDIIHRGTAMKIAMDYRGCHTESEAQGLAGILNEQLNRLHLKPVNCDGPQRVTSNLLALSSFRRPRQS